MKHPTISNNESKKNVLVSEDFIHDTHVHLENLTLDSSLPTSRSDQDVMSGTTINSNTSTMATSFSNTDASENANDQVTSITITANGTNETWELTWPIWHMLPRSERKAIANEHGFATIGHFEESVILSRALQENDIPAAERGIDGVARMPYEPYDSNEMQDLEHRPERYGLPMVMEKSSIADTQDEENDGEDEESSPSSREIEMDRQLLQHACIPSVTTKYGIETLELEDRIEQGGYLLLLPDELILHSILPYLDLDHYVTLALVSPLYASFTRTEAVYKQLCQRNYLNQSKRKILQVQKFGGSYRAMLERRYRVKMGCGLYVLKCSKVRKIQRDMWTEIPHGVILESTYYRYLSFQENGKVLYALSSEPPHLILPKFKRIKRDSTYTNPILIFGSYQVQKNAVVVHVSHPWHEVKLELEILDDGCVGALGKFWALNFVRHFSSASGDFDEYWSRDLVQHDVPSEPFRFLRHWRF